MFFRKNKSSDTNEHPASVREYLRKIGNAVKGRKDSEHKVLTFSLDIKTANTMLKAAPVMANMYVRLMASVTAPNTAVLTLVSSVWKKAEPAPLTALCTTLRGSRGKMARMPLVA